ncbi:MAG TPA: ABC transporter ATP-binding protein [Woeseiaceae bacterium]|nr:ABC transporter ATP-binding protein [Woeseiaceae bacterium]
MSISLEQVSKSYDGGAAVSDVTVDIGDGELFVLLGPSGSGKSTLLRAIAGLTTIDHGRIVLHGRDVSNVNAREREVGFVFQNYALFRHMTLADNIEFALCARHVPAARRRKRRQELLKLVSLEGYDHRYPTELSGGQQQRVAVARALAHEPRVLLLDEPFGALDAKIREELRRAIRDIQRTVGITTILVTHDQEEAFSMADRIGVMDRGRLQEVGEPRALYRQPATRFVATFLGAANLLLGNYGYSDVRLGDSWFPVQRWSRSLCSGDEATIVVRPEDVEIAEQEDSLSVPAAGIAEVAELQFVGSIERLRLTLPASATLASALRPDADSFLLEAARTARAVEELPLTAGQKVWVGFKGMHALPTPISSLRLLARTSEAFEELANSVLVRELAERMRIAPVRIDPGAPGTAALRGMPVVSLRQADDLSEPLGLLDEGARQVLVLLHAGQRAERMLILVEPSATARDATLAAAASLARHLTIDVTMLVHVDKKSGRGTRYRELLDLRNTSLRSHGLDIRTETYHGSLRDAVAARQSSPGQVLLVAGLASLDGRLLGSLKEIVRETPPAGLVLVSGRAEREARKQATMSRQYIALAR